MRVRATRLFHSMLPDKIIINVIILIIVVAVIVVRVFVVVVLVVVLDFVIVIVILIIGMIMVCWQGTTRVRPWALAYSEDYRRRLA